jgi:hypothetical protein
MTSLWNRSFPTFVHKSLPESSTRFRRPTDATVASLPRQTLAEVAEDLVRLTITRQRVWADDVDTVGGDIDVAVISRAEGFVWAKRRVEA